MLASCWSVSCRVCSCAPRPMGSPQEKKLKVERAGLDRWILVETMTVRRPGVVADPAEFCKAAAEFFRDGGREPRMDIFEPAPPGIASCGFMQGKQSLPAFAGRAAIRVEQQVRFRGKAKQRCAADFFAGPVPIRQNNFRDEERILQIGKRVRKILCGVDVF